MKKFVIQLTRVSILLGVSGCTAMFGDDFDNLHGLPTFAVDTGAPGDSGAGETSVVPIDSTTPDTGTGNGAGNCNNLLQDDAETDIDCGGGTCNTCALGDSCTDNGDCANDSCLSGVCQPVTCTNGDQDPGETATDCGGGDCPGCPAGDNCIGGRDCLSDVCEGNQCQQPACDDGVMNGSEIDIDCGASCGACATGQNCGTGEHCSSGVCEDNRCVGGACTDGVSNGAETDIDCGGETTCSRCDIGQQCNDSSGSDCLSGICQADAASGEMVCVSAGCTDGVLGGDETDGDCGGSCPSCDVGQSCSGGGDCLTLACVNGVCAAASCSDSLLNGNESDLDCGGGFPCDPCDTSGICGFSGDCASRVCDLSVCQAPSCDDSALNGTETGVDCGGGCDGCTVGLPCEAAEDCAVDLVCLASGTGSICASALCQNNGLNQGETDIDCGGPNCPVCELGDACEQGSDCVSDVCADNLCATPTCEDGVTNQDESDTDCGGATCDPCDDFDDCLAPGDCLSGVCSPGQYCSAPTCEDGGTSTPDGVLNGNETAIDCGGGSPCLPCVDGLACNSGSDCASGVCPDGFCSTPNCNDNSQNQDETDEDCGGACGATCGLGQGCALGSDCITSVCSGNTCQSLSCTDGFKNGTESDVDCGGSCGANCAADKLCDSNVDCASLSCVSAEASLFRCAAPTCEDAIQNQGESDADCGGTSPCARCAATFRCWADSDCESSVCDESAQECLAPICEPRDFVQNGDETDTDCGGEGCPTCAAGQGCALPTDCDSSVCNASQVCEAAACPDGVPNGSETDTDCGGPIVECATRCAEGKSCTQGSDCIELVCGGDQLCAAPTCSDSQSNGDESGVDCGGTSSCGDCGAGQGCTDDTDCDSSLICHPTSNTCTSATCNDTQQNGTETDVDCGGSCPAACADDLKCIEDSDCVSGSCVTLVCTAASCSDGKINQGEGGVDCGGPCDPCPDGSSCNNTGDCEAGASCYNQLCCRAISCESEGWSCDSISPGCGLADENCGSCNDSNLCTTESCNPTSHTCDSENNSLVCNDGVACTDDVCTGGSCIGSDNCLVGTCIESVGVCSTALDLYVSSIDEFGALVADTFTESEIGLFSFNEDLDPGSKVVAESLAFAESNFGNAENINAISVLGSGNIVLGVTGASSIGGVNYGDGELIQWDPASETASVFFDAESVIDCAGLFCNSEFDALHVFADGTFVFSTPDDFDVIAEPVTQSFGPGDLVLYDPNDESFTLKIPTDDLDEANIDGVTVHPLRLTWLLSFTSDTTVGGVSVADGDILELGWGPADNTANHTNTKLFFEAAVDADDDGGDINGISIGVACVEGQACDDFVACTTGDICTSGVCAGTPNDGDCTAGNSCTSGSCVAALGCQYAATNEGGSCDDGIACTTDTCELGSCVGVSSCGGGLDCQPDTGSCASCGNGEVYFGNSCYYFRNNDDSIGDSEDYCTARDTGWDIVQIESDLESAHVLGMINAVTWIGGSDAAQEGRWLMPDGTHFWEGGSTGVEQTYANWRVGEPSAALNTYDCNVMYPGNNGEWDNERCLFNFYPVVCEGPPITQ
ncbi:MAG: hypothetical protein HRU17_07840 [Polyangiaceae bacterium]|nr:hypothetical protein [Polyangiaceae bacterium]